MIFSEALLLSIIANYSLPFVRISACIMSMMAFGSGSVPLSLPKQQEEQGNRKT